MNESVNETGGTGPSHRGVEIGVALAIAALGLISIIGGMQVGIGWGADGPRAGFFPFYVGIIIIISSRHQSRAHLHERRTTASCSHRGPSSAR